MATIVLTDTSRDLWVDSLAVHSADLGFPASSEFSITKRTLKGGRRDGVDFIQVENGALSFSIVPTRGMGIWKGRYHGDFVGWNSPVADGPIHPAYVNLMSQGGLGWLDGFDEVLVRCGLENNGAPFQETATNAADGSKRDTLFGLHGKIANLAAHYVAIHIDEKPPHEITIEGHVIESKLFHLQIRMVTKISTVPGSNVLKVHDEFHNLRDSPSEFQVLYHWNFGPPHLDEGARLVAPIQEVCPRDPRAQEGIGHYDVYKAPEAGYAEQVYFFKLHGDPANGKTLAMLRNHKGDKAVALRFSTKEMPCFTLWKNTGGLKEGYVTGLEPATNYPNARPFEKKNGRVVTLPPGGCQIIENVLEVLNTSEAVAKAEAEVKALQSRGGPTVHKAPVEPLAPVAKS